MKKFILTLFVGLFGFVGFGYCETIGDLLDTNTYIVEDVFVSQNDYFPTVLDFGNIPLTTICVKFFNMSTQSNFYVAPMDSFNPSFVGRDQYYNYWGAWEGNYSCFYGGDTFHYLSVGVSNDVSFDIEYFFMNTFLSQSIPIMDSQSCQLEYSLMPISSCNSEYCEMNNLCEVIGSSGSSTLYINNILHQSAPLIDISIPEEFEWNYTGSSDLFELDVVGYNTDPDYIAGIITTQKTTPNNQDFNNIISGLIPLLIPGLVVILFIYFVFRFVKKIF